MNLTPLYDTWMKQLAGQERTVLLLAGVSIFFIMTIALAHDKHRRWMLPVMAIVFGFLTVSLVLSIPSSRGRLMLTQPLWYDETFTWRVARLPFSQMLDALSGDVHPPLWYVIEWITIRLIGDSEIAIRFPALAFGVLGVWLTWVLARAIGCGRRVSHCAAVGMAVMPGWIYYAQEARMYTLLACAVLVAAIGMVTRRLWLMAIGMIVAVYTHNLGAFYVAVIAVLAVQRGDTGYGYPAPAWRFPVTTLAWFGFVGAAWLPWLSVLAGQVNSVGQAFWIPNVSLGGYLLGLCRIMMLIGAPISLQVPALVIAFGLLSLVVWISWRDRSGWGITLLSFGIGPVVMIALVSEVWKPVFLFRALSPSLPFIAIMVVLALDRVPVRHTATIATVIVAVVALVAVGQGKEGELFDIWMDIAEIHQDGDVIYHVSLVSYIPLSYYLPEPEYRHVVQTNAGNLSQSLSLHTQVAMSIPRMDVAEIDADRLLVLWTKTPMTTIEEVQAFESVLEMGESRKLDQWIDETLITSQLWAVDLTATE